MENVFNKILNIYAHKRKKFSNVLIQIKPWDIKVHKVEETPRYRQNPI